MRPSRPCKPNSGYSLGKTCGCEVHSQCVVCSRCMVSAVPNSPDCTANASNPAANSRTMTGLFSHRERREVIIENGNTIPPGGSGTWKPDEDSRATAPGQNKK